MPLPVTSASPAENRQAAERFSQNRDITDLNRLKMAELNAQMDGSSIGGAQNFKGALKRTQAGPSQSQWDFSGGEAAELQEYSLQKTMEGKNKGAFSQLLTADDLDKQMNFLVELIVEDFKNPDPTQERDHTQQTMAMLTMMSAGSQMQVATNVGQLSKQTEQQTQLILESRIGKKVQYRDRFLELSPGSREVPIRYRLGKDAAAGVITIYDIDGNTVEEVRLNDLKKGDHQFNWTRSQKNSRTPAKDGIYFVDINLRDTAGNPLQETEYLLELEGTISGIEKNKHGLPIYYVGGQPVQGALTRISRGGEFDHFAASEPAGDVRGSTRPILGSARQRQLAEFEATRLRDLRHNPYVDAVA